MAIPEPNRFTDEEICKRWTEIYSYEYTPKMIRRMGSEGQLEVQMESVKLLPQQAKTVEELTFGRKNNYYISRIERDRFEAENPPPHRSAIELTPKSKNAYLRLLGYMAERLAETDSLPIDKPVKAAEQIITAADLMGRKVGSRSSVSEKIKNAVSLWRES